MRSPPGAEHLAPRRELADEIGQTAVVRVAAGLGAQHGDGVGRHLFPVGVEVTGARVEEDEARRVGGTVRAVVVLRVEGAAEMIGSEEVHTPVADERRRGVDRVENPLHARPEPPGRRSAPPARRRIRGACEVEEMRPLRIVELERTG